MQNQTQSRPLAPGLTLLSALGRLVPHAPNVTPLGGSCLFAGSRISGPLAYLLPLAVMIATDPLVGGYTAVTPAIYASFLISVWIGRKMLRNVTPVRVGGAAFLSSLQFFVITNLAIWVAAVAHQSTMYTADFAGLVKCYTMALPFWGRTLAGDLLFSGAIFGMYELLTRRSVSKTARATA
ncbi:MAG TPA: DUF6580 family putative transport protein [Bryobacteraceae bacterium]|nr:DUF6580 family putative transport protein [Bryobacteraceae bacterium]